MLSSYTLATKSPVLTQAMLLRARYAESGTDMGYAGTSLFARNVAGVCRPWCSLLRTDPVGRY
eukprot:2678080-Rhodomonas_salina.2